MKEKKSQFLKRVDEEIEDNGQCPQISPEYETVIPESRIGPHSSWPQIGQRSRNIMFLYRRPVTENVEHD